MRGRRLIDCAVETKDTAIGTQRISLVGFAESLFQAGGDGGAARIVMLDDHRGRGVEFSNQVESAVQVQNVVERQLLAVQRLGGGDAGMADIGGDVGTR